MSRKNRIYVDAGRGKERYDLVVCRVMAKDAAGRPRELIVIDDDETVHLDDGDPNEFVIVFGLHRVFHPDFQ